jgi:hypothetical protein
VVRVREMTGRKFKTKGFSVLLITIFVLLSMGGSVLAKDPEFRLDMDTLNLQKGTSTNLVLSVINANNAQVVDITGLDNFDVVSKSNSTSTRIINGDKTVQINYVYVIMPKTTGKFTLQGIVRYNGTDYKTNQLEVNVSEAGNNTKGEAKDLFVKTILSSNEIYFGQKTVLSYELYCRSRYNIEDYGFRENVNIKDFISKDIQKDKLKANMEYVDGNKYAKYEVKKTFLSPVKTGKFTIPEYNLQANVSTGDGFFDSYTPVYLKTEAKEITVKPLPQANKPADFSGIVGNLKLETGYSRQEVNYGESITLSITASGNCNLDDVKKIVSDKIPGFSVYQTVKNTEESLENNQYNARKEFEIILVPEKNGKVTLDPMYVSFFNPESGSYEKAEIPGTTITVNGDVPQVQSGNFNPGNSDAKAETIKISQVDYKPKNQGYLTIQLKKDYLLKGSVIFVILIIAAVLFILVFFRWRKQDKKLQGIYRQICNADDKNEIYNLFNDMMKYCFNVSLKASSRNDIEQKLADHKVTLPVLEVMSIMEDDKQHSGKEGIYLKDKIKEIYKILKSGG